MTDTNGNWSTGRVDVAVNADYNSWAQNKFTASELSNTNLSSQAADPDSDGISNLLEFLMGLEPKTFNGRSNGIPHTTISGGLVEYTFPRFKFTHLYGWLTGDITDNITKWSSNPPQPGLLSLETISTLDNGLTETVTQRSSTPLTNSPNQFLRLQIFSAP